MFLILSPTSLNIESVAIRSWGTEFVPGILYTFAIIFILIYLLWSAFNLFITYKSATGLNKVQITYVFLGTALMAITGIITAGILPLVGYSRLSVLSPISALFFLTLVSYAIVKHRLLDIEIIIRRSLVYSVLLVSLIALYTVLVFGLNSIFLPGGSAAFPRITDLIAIVVIAFTVDPIKRFIEQSTDKIFFKARYNAEEALSQISETLSSVIELKELVTEIKKVLKETIKVSKVAIYIKTDHHYSAVEIANDFPNQLDLMMEKKYFFNSYFQDHHEILMVDEINRALEDGQILDDDLTEAVKFLGKNGVEVIAPLLVKNELRGSLFLGEKLSQDIYSGEDIRFLEILSHQAALALENAKLYEEQKLYGVRLKQEVDRATADLRSANERLKELDKAKDEFVSIASHELRTPMTAIKSYVWMALNGRAGKISGKVRTYLTTVYDSSERMIALINDMLSASRLETGRIEIDIEPVSVYKVADQVLEDLSLRAKELRLDLTLQKESVIPMVLADRNKLTEIFTNLIGNALKFTKKGGKIRITAKKASDNVEVSISDTGVGIPKEQLDKIFTKFGRVGESYATIAQTSGTGLGLYITRNYLDKMGGKIWVESALGKGTTFTFSLPIAKGAKEAADDNEDFSTTPIGVIKNEPKT